jgi:hypothetical protein
MAQKRFSISSRDLSGKAIVDQGDQIEKVNDILYKVKSQSGKGFYEVKSTKNGMTCTCPDLTYRGGRCKHITATRYYLEVERTHLMALSMRKFNQPMSRHGVPITPRKKPRLSCLMNC